MLRARALASQFLILDIDDCVLNEVAAHATMIDANGSNTAANAATRISAAANRE